MRFFKLTFSFFKTPLWCAAFLIVFANPVFAVPLAEYRERVHEAVLSLEDLAMAEADEDETVDAKEIFAEIRRTLPPNQKIELPDKSEFTADNTWLENGLKNIETASVKNRANQRQAVAERLGAIENRLRELENAQAAANSANTDKQKLEEILRRPEYRKPSEKDKSVLQRWTDSIVEWLANLFRSDAPRPQPEMGAPPDLSALASVLRFVVIGLALLIIGFVVWKFLLPLLGRRRTAKPKKKRARVILGEAIAADETADDLLTQADRLANNGELRAAIRKGYIAALCDLSDRQVLGLARHKTNRDYLRDVRQRENIYQPMRSLTGSFERHWYGAIPAEIEDWQTFRNHLSFISNHLSRPNN